MSIYKKNKLIQFKKYGIMAVRHCLVHSVDFMEWGILKHWSVEEIWSLQRICCEDADLIQETIGNGQEFPQGSKYGIKGMREIVR